MKMKRLLSSITVLLLCLTLFPFARPADAAQYDYISYEIVDGAVTITGCNAGVLEVEIPGAIEGYPVTRIASNAFDNCEHLKFITVAENNAYYSSDKYGVLYNKDKTLLILFPENSDVYRYNIPDGVTQIGANAFSWCTKLTNVTIPDSVTVIGGSAFYMCEKLTSVTIPDSVTSMGNYVFFRCSNLRRATIGNGVAEIGECAFKFCEYLWSVTLGTGVTKIGKDAFAGCRELKEINFYGDAPSFGIGCFSNTGWFGVHYHADTTGWENAKKYFSWTTMTKTAHDYLEYTYDNNHTCTADGTERAACIYCNKVNVRTAEGSAPGHIFTDYFSNNDATCFKDGTKTGVCIYCGITETVIDTGSKAHRYADGNCIYCGVLETFSASLSGRLTAYGEGAVSLKLSSQDGDAVTLSVTETDYLFTDLLPGEYMLVVFQTGSVSRTYDVTLLDGENILDLKLHLPGDINGDGRYNMGDTARIYAHVKASAILADYELLCADYSGDGKVNIGDTAKVYAIVKSA